MNTKYNESFKIQAVEKVLTRTEGITIEAIIQGIS